MRDDKKDAFRHFLPIQRSSAGLGRGMFVYNLLVPKKRPTRNRVRSGSLRLRNQTRTLAATRGSSRRSHALGRMQSSSQLFLGGASRRITWWTISCRRTYRRAGIGTRLRVSSSSSSGRRANPVRAGQRHFHGRQSFGGCCRDGSQSPPIGTARAILRANFRREGLYLLWSARP